MAFLKFVYNVVTFPGYLFLLISYLNPERGRAALTGRQYHARQWMRLWHSLWIYPTFGYLGLIFLAAILDK